MSLESAWGLESWGGDASGGDADHGRETPVPGIGNYDCVSPETAREELLNYLVFLKDKGTLSAVSVCQLCFWICRSNVGPTGSDKHVLSLLAKAPGAQSGKYSVHYDKVMGGKPTARNWYRVPAPSFRRCTGERILKRIPTLPPHEAISDLMQKHAA